LVGAHGVGAVVCLGALGRGIGQAQPPVMT